jgi:hypothetical protein
MFTRRSSVQGSLSRTFGQLHQRTASLKSQGIPLIAYEGHSSDFSLFSVSENDHEPQLDDDDDPGGAFDDPDIFQIIDMSTQAEASTTLPPPALQRRSSQSSLRKERRDEDGTTMARLKEHLFAEVDGEQSSAPLSAFCFMTGFMCVDHTLFTSRLTRPLQ